MVAAPGGGVNLAEIKAVSDGFPLRGRIRVAPSPEAPDREAAGGPARGTVWIGVPMVARIGAKVGDVLQVGRARLAVAAVITREPDSVLDYFGLAPRVLMHDADVESTGLIKLGSAWSIRLLVSGETVRCSVTATPRSRGSCAASAWKACATRAARCALRSSARSFWPGWRRCCRCACVGRPWRSPRGVYRSARSTAAAMMRAWGRVRRRCSRFTPGSSCPRHGRVRLGTPSATRRRACWRAGCRASSP